MMNNQLSQEYQSMRNYNPIADCDQTKRYHMLFSF